MKITTSRTTGIYYRYTRFLGAMLMVALMATMYAQAIPTLNLRSMDSFVILAGSTVTVIPPVAITGNVGLSPAAGSYITGFDGSDVTGILYVVDASGPAGSVENATLLQTAKSDLTTAYNDAAGRTPVPTGDFLNPNGGNIGGLNLVPGLYKFTSAAAITGSNVTLTGNATDVWIFQIGTSLNVGSGIQVTLAGGAQAANIFWQVGSSATIGTYAVFKGTILADQSISFGTGATMEGRALAFAGAVTIASGFTAVRAVLSSAPIFSVNPTQLAFGNVNNGTTKRDSVTVTNTGNADLIFSSVTSSNSLYTVTPTTGTITPGSTRKFYITFAPLANGAQNGYIYFNHNAANSRDSVSLSGTGVSPRFSVSPASLAFGNVRNELTKRDSVTVTNTGTSNLIISSITSSNTTYTVTPASGTITPGSTLKFYVTFAPLVDGLQTGYIYFNHNASNLKDSISVSGTGVSPMFSVSPTSLNFGDVRDGTTKRDSVTVTNTGTSDLVISSVLSSNTLFTVTPITGTITPGSTLKFYITFAPLVDGLQVGYIYYIHNAKSAKDSISIRGTGVSPRFTVSPASLSFGNVRNELTKRDSVTVTNTGTSDLVISSVTSSNALFTFTPASGTITPGSTLKFYVTFSPLVDGLQNGYIYFNHNASNLKDSISVSGTGVSPRFSVNPLSLNFGNVRNETSKRDSVTVTNTGTADLIISSVTSSNTLFTVTPAAISTITPGSSLKFYITFSPLVDGLQNGYIYFYHNAKSPKDSVSVSGTGVSPMFSVSPMALNFGNVRDGLSKRDSVTVTNTGTADLVISIVTSSNTLFTATPLSATITPGSTRKFYITFAPLADGLTTGYIYFIHNAKSAKDSISVSGTGVSSIFTVSPMTLNFGNVNTGLNKRDVVTVTNTGTADLIISSITSSNTLFVIAPVTGLITPGSSMQFIITFSPLADGLQTGKIYFNHNAANRMDSISVSGTGVTPGFSVNPRILNFGNVINGTTKMDSVTVTNTGTADLIISSFSSSNFRFIVTSINAIITPGSSQKFYVTFTPLVSGFQDGYIHFNFNTTNARDSIYVTGTGVGNPVFPIFTVNPTSLNFGNVIDGTTKSDSVTVTNTGTANLVIYSMSSGNAFYTVKPGIGIITPGASQKFYVTFAPLTPGFQSGYIYFYHNATSAKDSIYVTGTGVGNDLAPKFSVKYDLDFGNVFIGKTKQKSVIVTNIGTSDLKIMNITSSDAQYTMTPIISTITPGASLEIFITFAPMFVGQANAKIIFIHNAGRDTINVTGIGVNNLTVITIDSARKLPVGTEFAIEGIVTRTMGSYTRIQDLTAGLTIVQTSGSFFNDVANFDIQMTDVIRVQGRISEIDYLRVINSKDLTGYSRISRLNMLPAPLKVTLSELAANGEKYESRLITLVNLAITSGGDFTFNQDKTYQTTDASDKTNAVVIRIGNRADTEMDGMPFLSTSVGFVGVLSQSSVSSPTAGYQLTPVLPTDLFFNPDNVFDMLNPNPYSLSDNYPNPFNSSTTIQYYLRKPELVSLKVFNIIGKEVATLVSGFQEAGAHTVLFSPEGIALSPGSCVYFYRLEVGTYVSTKQMILVK